MAEWKEKADKIKSERKKEEKERIKLIKEELSEVKQQLLKKKEEDTSDCNKKIEELKEQIKHDRSEIESLGFFDISKKKELNANIEENEKGIEELENEKAKIQNEFEDGIKSVDEREEKKLELLTEELDIKYVIPEDPEEIERQKKIEEKKNAIDVLVYDAVMCCGPATAKDLQDSYLELSEMSLIEIRSSLRRLEEQAKVVKTIDKRSAYYEVI